MKTMRKLLSLALALVMIMSLAATAFAADGEDTTNLHLQGNVAASRDFNAYMLMSATNSASTNFSYTVNPKYEAIMRSYFTLDAEADVDLIIKAVSELDDAGIRAFANAMYSIILADPTTYAADASWTGADTTVDQGYWLIADVSDTNDLNGAYTRSLVMIDTVGDEKATVTLKDYPLEESKKTDDENDSLIEPDEESEDAETRSDVVDYDIGDNVPYDLFTKLPANASDYSYFVWMVKDTASEGLTFNEDSFKITINSSIVYTTAAGEIAEAGSAGAADAKFLYAYDGNTLYLYPNAGYTRLDKTVVAEPGTYADDGSVIGGDIRAIIEAANTALNGATVVFDYTCKLNENAVVGGEGNSNTFNLIYSNDPYNDSFGETPDDINIVLTWKVIVNKIDGSNSKPLEGADFKLYKFIAKHPETTDAALMEQYEDEGLTHLDSANAWGDWVEVTRKTTNASGENGATTFNFSGIDDGFYKLEETQRPEGYNAIDPIVFKISAKHAVDLTSGKIWGTEADNDELVVIDVVGVSGGTTSESNGSITMNVANNAGAELPSTGGMGTTVLYIVGGLMVMFAVVMLVTKKRMSA